LQTQRHKKETKSPGTEANSKKRSQCALLSDGLPTTLAASESDGGLGVKMVFERHIVWPDGHREIEGVTAKQLPAPASHVLPRSDRRVSNSDDSDDKSDT